MAVNGVICAEVPLRNHSLTQSLTTSRFVTGTIYMYATGYTVHTWLVTS